jgi:hypothetical protein
VILPLPPSTPVGHPSSRRCLLREECSQLASAADYIIHFSAPPRASLSFGHRLSLHSFPSPPPFHFQKEAASLS